MSSAQKEGSGSPEGSLGPSIVAACVKSAKVLNTESCTMPFCCLQCKMEAVKDDPTVTLSNPKIFTEEKVDLLRAAILKAVALEVGHSDLNSPAVE